MRIQLLFIGLILGILQNSCTPETSTTSFEYSWQHIPTRTWAGEDFWANRLQDWRVENGQLNCISDNPRMIMRTVHLISRRLALIKGEAQISSQVSPLHEAEALNSAAGFLIGAGPERDVLGASLVQQLPGKGAGLFAGINGNGKLFIKDFEKNEMLVEAETTLDFHKNMLLTLSIKPTEEGSNIVLSGRGDMNISANVSDDKLVGNIALVSHPGDGENLGRYGFSNLNVNGSKITSTEIKIGPVIGSQYTLSKNIMKLTAQMAPIGKDENHQVTLETEKEGKWIEVAQTEIIEPGFTAPFRVENWDETVDTDYRINYRYIGSGGNEQVASYEGTIRHDPVEKDEIVVAGFTGNHNVERGMDRKEGTFAFDSTGLWYPHEDIVKHVSAQNPDVLFFSGDQVYEGASPTFPDKAHYELDYLYKWYLWHLAYRPLTKNIPTISIPDDHDVYQGNLWGAGGPVTDKDDKGGYVHPAWFVKMVERTQCSHFPDPYDPTPIEQGIGVYYTSMNYGEIGFAILEDRKFKSGCAGLPFQTRGRPDHIIDPEFDVKRADVPGVQLLGERQLRFLNEWGQDWGGQQMKIALSQTVFANMATHHGGNLFRLIADLDSNGWPQTGRNKAIDALRKSFAFHLAGDQHLASLVHHGIDEWGDGIYSFCVPSIANFYPRVWFPEAEGIDRPEGAPTNMGKHKDGLGNLVTVYGVTNPTAYTGISTGIEPLQLHDRMPGYGIVRMNKTDQTITMECWPRYADPVDPNAQQYKGWPKTIKMTENYGRKAVALLPEIQVSGMDNPVIQVVNEATNEPEYTLRIKGNRFQPKVFAQGSYTVRVGEKETPQFQEVKGLKSGDTGAIKVNFAEK